MAWLLLLPAGALLAEAIARGRTYSKNFYVFVILPLYYFSVLLLPLLPLSSWGMRAAALAAAIGLGAVRMGIMTVVLHRYAAHAAFRCNWVTNLALGLLGCFANQGGPLWWASKHRCHHKFCDGPFDPHSPNQRSPEEAFSFFTEAQHEPIDERFAPRHCDTPGMRIIDAFSSVPLLVEHYLAFHVFGVDVLRLGLDVPECHPLVQRHFPLRGAWPGAGGWLPGLGLLRLAVTQPDVPAPAAVGRGHLPLHRREDPQTPSRQPWPCPEAGAGPAILPLRPAVGVAR
eukprot:CAMPEP_0175557678 /NCGR_PEP_ID=MMETSP0096-20121207/35499_1 /TAXON_ID=311494 /ORGANISM="Alexandrium monilatum, Strain CCMP3105" /LENGTH=285 /DNA_ID=CAMNT_0016860835 /DNA_START=1 /DNA_END=855 /DNA_ORIENTATION=-